MNSRHFFAVVDLHFFYRTLTIMVTFLVFTGCSEPDKKEISKKEATLKSVFKNQFYIGTALNENQIAGNDSLATKLLKEQFTSISPENCMKWMFLHPKKDTFFFDTADKYVSLGADNDMFVIGHNLVWHSQLAPWVAEVETKEELTKQLKNHIVTIVGHFKGKVDGWDVVNEALNEDGTLRESVFLKVLGKNYLSDSFKWASEADPEAELYYNDYNLCNPEKREGALRLVKTLQENGTKIDGIGMQGHWNLESPSLEEIEASILAYSQLGIKVMITELDITVLPNPLDITVLPNPWDLEGAEVSQNFENSKKMNPYPNGLPDSVSVALAKRYKDIFSLFLKHQDKISRVTFWGLNDDNSWLNNWPVRGRTNYPLLFDRNYGPKAAYDSIMKLSAN